MVQQTSTETVDDPLKSEQESAELIFGPSLICRRREEVAMAQRTEPVAFLGIGTMGHAMATRALGAGIPTIVWNRNPDATRVLAISAQRSPNPPAMQSAGLPSSSRWSPMPTSSSRSPRTKACWLRSPLVRSGHR